MNQHDLNEFNALHQKNEQGKLPASARIKYLKLLKQAQEEGILTDSKSTTEDIKRKNDGATKTYKLISGREVEAKLMFVEAGEVESKVKVHPDNDRAQETLTRESLWDILPFVEHYGVQTEGIACYDKDHSTLLAIDCSRRRQSAIYANAGLPLWVIDASDLTEEEVKGLMKIQHIHRAISRRELGKKYVAAYYELGTYDAVFDFFKVPEKKRKTEERKLIAALIDSALINLFVDPMGIPNDYYTKLNSLEKKIKAKDKDNEFAVAQFCADIEQTKMDFGSSIEEEDIQLSHQETLKLIEAAVEEKSEKKPTWSEPTVHYQGSRTKFIRTTEHKSGRKFKAEFSYLTKEQGETFKKLFSIVEDEEKMKKIQKILNS